MIAMKICVYSAFTVPCCLFYFRRVIPMGLLINFEETCHDCCRFGLLSFAIAGADGMPRDCHEGSP